MAIYQAKNIKMGIGSFSNNRMLDFKAAYNGEEMQPKTASSLTCDQSCYKDNKAIILQDQPDKLPPF